MLEGTFIKSDIPCSHFVFFRIDLQSFNEKGFVL